VFVNLQSILSNKNNSANEYQFVGLFYKQRSILNLGAVNGVTTSVANTSLPEGFALGQNFPNPFNPATRINYGVPDVSVANVELSIYNLMGQKQRTRIFTESANCGSSFSQ
jgi:hypothetical protein